MRDIVFEVVVPETYSENEGRIIVTMVHMNYNLTKTALAAAMAATGGGAQITASQARNAAEGTVAFMREAFPDIRVTCREV